MKRVLLVIGTRPETIKMAPVYHALRARGMDVHVCSTGQHGDLIAPVCAFFDMPIHTDLDVMTDNQSLYDVTAQVLLAMRDVIERVKPELMLIQGDTTSVMAAALAAFYARVPVGHVEAGLRTWDMTQPWPEELNRWIADAASALHFAPTEDAKAALLQNGIPPTGIHVTGNTVVDALAIAQDKLKDEPFQPLDLSAMPRIVMLTVHRRESFGEPMRRVFRAVRDLAEDVYLDVHFVFPTHPNPNVRNAVEQHLGNARRVHIIDPLPYPECVKLMRDCTMILTDSGGIQEEAPALGKPVLVLRDRTERPEGLAQGAARIVGTEERLISDEVCRLLDDPDAYAAMAQVRHPYGDGQAAERIAEIVARELDAP